MLSALEGGGPTEDEVGVIEPQTTEQPQPTSTLEDQSGQGIVTEGDNPPSAEASAPDALAPGIGEVPQPPEPPALPFENAAASTPPDDKDGVPTTPEARQEQAPDGPEDAPDLLARREQFFGKDGFLYGLIKDNKGINDDAKNQVDADYEKKAQDIIAGIEKATKEELPLDKKQAIIQNYYDDNKGKYQADIEAKKNEIIADKLQKVRDMSPNEAIDFLFDDADTRATAKEQLKALMDMGKPQERRVEPQSEKPGVDQSAEDLEEMDDFDREETLGQKVEKLLQNSMEVTSMEDFFTALLVAGDHMSYRGSYNNRFKENGDKFRKFGIEEFETQAIAMAKKLNLTDSQDEQVQMKFGYQALLSDVVKQMERNGVELKTAPLEQLKNLNDNDLKEPPKDNLLQERMKAFFVLMIELKDAGKVEKIDMAFKESFKERKMDYDEKLAIDADLVTHFRWLATSKTEYQKVFTKKAS